jgi:hypothetical protein
MKPVAAEFISIQRMICTGCGAEANAPCNCGVSYVPKVVRAREAIAANPEKSNRAIAEEIGADEKTVRKARADQSAPESVTGKDGKNYPAKRPRNDEYEEAVDSVVERADRLESRVSELTEALNAKEVEASRNWPADMTEKQIKKRDKYLANIAWWQRELEKLYGEVTGQPPWRVVLIAQDGVRYGNGALLATRGEAESYGQTAMREIEGKGKFEILQCENEKANMQFTGTSIYFNHGDCVLLNWRPITDPALTALPPPEDGLDIPDYLKRS